VLAFHETVLGARDAHRAMLFNVALLAPQLQSAVLGRYRLLLGSFVEPVARAVPALTEAHACAVLLPVLERLLSSPVFWAEPVPAPVSNADELRRHARMVTQMALTAAREIAADPPSLEAAAVPSEQPAWLAPLRADGAPHATWNDFTAARGDTAVDAVQPPGCRPGCRGDTRAADGRAGGIRAHFGARRCTGGTRCCRSQRLGSCS
jgi:hypothetical protein